MGLVRLFSILACFAASALRAEDGNMGFTHIRLHPDFLQSQDKIRMNIRNAQPEANWREKLIPHLFDQEVAQAVAGVSRSKSMAARGDGQQSLLYSQIHNWLGSQYQGIGQQEAGQVQLFNQQFNLGAQNFSGFTWQRPFGGFSLNAYRQISPDLFDSKRWIVMDVFTINVEATSFLGKLGDAGIVNMTASEIAGFAGVNFTRTYTTYSFAADFSSALFADFKDLFLPFLAHTPEGVLSASGGKVMRREDTWSMGAGGLIESPSYYGLSFNAGALAEVSQVSTLIVQQIPEDEAMRPGEYLRVSHKSTQKKSAGVSAGLQMDFFKILEMTLLSYDLEYQAKEDKEIHLSFRPEDRQGLLEQDKGREFASLLKSNSPNIQWLEPHVVKMDESASESSSSRAMLLLWGTLKKSSMERIRVIKDQVTKDFFSHHSESIRLVQNFWSRLFSSFIFRIFSFSSLVQNDAALTRKFNMEYEATLPQSADPKLMLAEHQEQFSMVLTMKYEAARTDRWQDRSYKKDMEGFMDRYTTLPAQFRTMVRNEELKGPMSVTMNMRIMGDGLTHFNSLTTAQVEGVFHGVCDEKKTCTQRLMAPYLAYKRVWEGTKRLELAQLKKCMSTFTKEIKEMAPLQALFGEYAFIHGQFNARSRSGMPFATSYSTGQFRGVGLIDTYQRQNGTRLPASILAD